MAHPSIDAHESAGDWLQWDCNWRRLEGERDAVLYTPQTPRSLLEFWQRAYFDDLWDLMGPRAPQTRVLELGSGRGTTSMYLASRHCDVTLVDRSPAALDLAVRNFQRHGLRAPHIVHADARATGLEPEGYDCIYNIGLLEHFDDPVPVLAESLRLLKPDGLIFMVIVPEGSRWRLPPARAVLNPIGIARRISSAATRRIASGISAVRGSPVAGGAHGGQGMVRTSHARTDYVRWMRALGQQRFECVPYNPYFSVYRSPALERLVTLPLYRWHLHYKRRRGVYPLLKTRAVASCDLLTGRKS
jgi:SAM-dependent methyltransferase